MINLLIDIDGVVRVGDKKIIPGAKEFISYMKEKKINYLFITNSTRNSRSTTARQLKEMGLDVKEEEIFTGPIATALYITSVKKNSKIFLLAEGDTDKDFESYGITVTRKEEPVDFVVLGYDRKSSFEKYGIIFRLLLKGSGFIAMNRDRKFVTENSVIPATGLYVKGLEYCLNKEAFITGKPNKHFFESALKHIGAKKPNTFVVGDSMESDIEGAKNSGLRSIMVKTGSFNKDILKKSKIKPTYLVESVAGIPKLLDRLG